MQKDAPPLLWAELGRFERWMTTESYGQVEPPIRAATAEVYVRLLRLGLGWALTKHPHKAEGDLQEIFFPDSSRDSAAMAFEFLQFLQTERGAASSYQTNVCRALTKCAKFVYRNQVDGQDSSADGYKELGVIRALQGLQKRCAKKASVAGRISDEQQKWLSWPEYLRAVSILKQEAYLPEGTAKHRAQRFQRYLICAVLSCIPDRQRTIRELELDRTFVFDSSVGCWMVKHTADDYKTGKAYGERPPLALPNSLNPVSYTHLRAHETPEHLVCRLLLEKKKS
eukprot:TRINITY_DN59719_c0_g1_i2.p1 TRINITY_DN59719_c0_g1~~TRINITY_DN59719_c0_g1_i2.p1  ORF type:complete len:283 (-),score=53.05 TRINITY_DN59719_c0_g1_i2:30-878(-)